MKPDQTRTRIFSHITRTRFLHLEDALTPAAPGKPGKIRFFIGQYRRRDQGGQGAEATAFHFLNADDARPLMADLSWSKPVDIKDYKGSANGDQPQSRVLKVRGPKDGKYWLEIQNGPGQIIGEGAVKPAGEPEASISIALSIWEARAMALAVLEYMQAYRVAVLLGTTETSPASSAGTQARHVDPATGEITSAEQDAADLFGPEPTPSGSGSRPERSQKAKAKKEIKDDPPTFYALANEAIQAGLLEKVQELIQAQCSWREKTQRLEAAMAA